METTPGNPSAPGFGCGIPTPPVIAGAPLLFPRHQKFSSPHEPAGDPILPPHASAGDPSPVCLVQQKLGAILCDLPCLPLFLPTQTRVTTAIASAIAILQLEDYPSVPFEMWMGEGVHHSGPAAPSCRLCLIACNSRQVDENRGRA